MKNAYNWEDQQTNTRKNIIARIQTDKHFRIN